MPLCKTGMWLKTKDEADNTAITDWVSAGRSVAELHRFCVRDGFDGKLTTMKEHVRGRCSCA
jgi:hypothetical protein